MKSSILILTFIAFCTCVGQAGTVLNGGFEEELSHWEVNGFHADDVNSFALYPKWSSDPTSLLEPVEGKGVLFISSGNTRGDLTTTTAEQEIQLKEGQAIRGSYFFATDDYMPWNDYGTISLIPYDAEKSEIVLAYADVNMVGNFKSTTHWRNFKHIVEANEVGTYTLSLYVANMSDENLSSYLLIDRLAIIDDPACDFELAGDVNGDCTVDFIDYAELNNMPDALSIADLENLASSWLVDCFETPEDSRCVVWDSSGS